MKCGVVVFPGSNCDHDVFHVLGEVVGQETALLWHRSTDLLGCDLVVLPGGFSYGDYLRAGAMAAQSPIMDAVREHARGGGLVLGICNGFQILLESGLLPGAMRRNRSLRFLCQDVVLRVERTDLPFTRHYREGELVSYCCYNARTAEAVQIGGVWTPVALRGRGYARAVVAGALQAAASEGVSRGVLFTPETNLPARRAYESLGFSVVGDYGLIRL